MSLTLNLFCIDITNYDSVIEQIIYNDKSTISYHHSATQEDQLACEIRNDICKGRLDKLEAYKREISEIKNVHPEYNDAYFSLARMSHERGEYAYADSLYNVVNHKTINSTEILHQIEYADNLISLSKFKRADSTLADLSKFFRDQKSPSPLYALYQEKFGLVNLYNSQFDEARRHFQNAEKYWKYNSIYQSHPWYAEYLNHKSILLIKTGEYENAEELLINLVETKCQSQSSILCADVNSNLGNLYRLLTNYEEAKGYFVRAKRIYSTIGNMSEYAISNSNLALTFDNLDMITEADSIYKETIELYENELGTLNLQYATILNNYAGLLEYKEDFTKAANYYQTSLDVISSTLGENSEFYVTVLSNIGILNEYIENYEEAESAYKKGLSIRENQLGKRHPKYVELLYNLAGLNIHIDPNKSAQYYKEANALNLELIHYYYSTFDQETRINYLNKMIIEVERFYSLVAQNPSLPGLTRQAMEMSYELKGLALEYHINPLVDSKQTKSPLYKEWKSKTDSIAQLITQEVKSSKDKEQRLSTLIAQARILERQLARSKQSNRYQKNGLNELLESLTPKTTLVEFVTFEMFEDGFWTDTVYYYALVYNSGDQKVEMIQIASEYKLKSELNSISGSTIPGDDLIKGLAKIWSPLRSQIQSSEQIIVSPAGALSKMPLAALSSIENSLLFEKRVDTYSTLRDIKLEETSESLSKVLLVGGINFDNENQTDLASTFQSIDGSLEEVNNIKQLLSEERQKEITILTDSGPTEQYIRSALEENSYDILHFATHGFFYDQIDRPELSDKSLRNKIITHKNPMMRSGIVMSGANGHWLQPVSVSGLEDNILTSFEISNMTIHSDLVVLSACESGLGDIHNEEGVFGLQRAFKMAGVDKLIMSLWKIPDKETAELMINFYEQLVESNDIHKSFITAQQIMASKYDPFFWAGFVLIE